MKAPPRKSGSSGVSWTRRQFLSPLSRRWSSAPEKIQADREPVRIQAAPLTDAAWRTLLGGAVTGPYARGKEGLLVRHFFRDAQDGVFVDAGCADPEENSGTCYLERYLGWSGLAVDRRDLEEPWRRARRNSRFLRATLGGPDQLGSTLDRVLEARALEAGGPEDMGLGALDFLSISLGGGELPVLKGFDLGRYRPRLIKIACGPGQRVPTRDYLELLGYSMILDYRPLDKIHRYFAPER
ncbi:MAG: hypothetical protein AAF725_03910 [Acidobacteriota bacterium]